jgi:hypothetical protein
MVGPAFSLKLVGPWTVIGKKNESGPNTTWSTPIWAKQRNGSCGWLAASAVPGSADSVTADASTRVTADARAAETRELCLPKLFLSLCPGFIISFVLSFADFAPRRKAARIRPVKGVS